MIRIFALAALLASTSAHAQTYFVQSETKICARADALMSGQSCVALSKGARVEWNGQVIDGFSPRYLGGNVAKLADGRFVYANFLGPTPPADPLKRSFVLAHEAIACPSRFKLADALEARATRNDGWFLQTGCRVIGRGTHAERLLSDAGQGPDLWQMRVETSQTVAVPLWMSATDFR